MLTKHKNKLTQIDVIFEEAEVDKKYIKKEKDSIIQLISAIKNEIEIKLLEKLIQNA